MRNTHSISLVDIPLVHRLADGGIVLDSSIQCTRASDSVHGRLLSSLLPTTQTHTLVARTPEDSVVGQFRFDDDGHNAHIIYMAPNIPPDHDDSAWLLLLDAMTAEAGRLRAHTLSAELDESSPLFITLRQAGFVVYARQRLWTVGTGREVRPPHDPAAVAPITAADGHAVQLLYGLTVPSLLQQIAEPPRNGFVYRQDGKVCAFIGYEEGRDGYYMMPFVHPDVLPQASAIIATVIASLPKTANRRVTVRVRRYQGWLNSSLEELNFRVAAEQAVMVRHIAVGVRSAKFASLRTKLKTVPAPIRPPSTNLGEQAFELAEAKPTELEPAKPMHSRLETPAAECQIRSNSVWNVG